APRDCASARPISIWKPGRSSRLLACGSASGLAHIEIVPRARTSASVRAAADAGNSEASKNAIASALETRRGNDRNLRSEDGRPWVPACAGTTATTLDSRVRGNDGTRACAGTTATTLDSRVRGNDDFSAPNSISFL